MLFKTTCGDLEVELWCREAQKTCRQFLDLCRAEFYNGSAIFKITPGSFAVLKSDRQAKNAKLPLERHSRLRFARRGLLAADPSEPNFLFFTLAPCSQLQGSHTIFGRVVGDSLFNLVRIGESATDPHTGDPIYPPIVRTVEIVSIGVDFSRFEPKEAAPPELERKRLQEAEKPVVAAPEPQPKRKDAQDATPPSVNPTPLKESTGQVELERSFCISKGRSKSARQVIHDDGATLEAINAFKLKLSALETAQQRQQEKEKEREVPVCELHQRERCKSCTREDPLGMTSIVAESEDGWLHHRLIFDS